jgi:hypothetical protein
MSILTFPALSREASSTLEWGLISNTLSFSSPLNGSEQTLEMPGARWAATLPYPSLNLSDAALVRAFLSQLRGKAGRFYMWNMAYENRRGTAGGTPIVSGAGQTGASLVTSGWPNSTTVLKAGDFVGIGGELKIMVADATSNGSGVATLAFSPPLRAAPSNGSAIVTTKPTCIMRLADDSQKWLTRPGHVSDFMIDCVESFQ